MLGNFLSFSIVAIGIGILFSLPAYLTRVQKPNLLIPLRLIFALSLTAFLLSYSLFAFIGATINNAAGACSNLQTSSFCLPYFSDEAVLDSMFVRELWLRNLLPPPLRDDICFVGHSWLCENASGLLETTPQWNDYLYQVAFALFSCLSCLIFLYPFTRAKAKTFTQTLPHQP